MMIPLRASGRRGFAISDPWVTVVIVAVLAVVAMVVLRRVGSESRHRVRVQRNLAVLADSQDAFKRRNAVFAPAFGSVSGPGVVAFVPDSGALVTITHADSLGWAATATHPALKGRQSTCYIYGGGTAPHDPKLRRPNEPRCW